MFNKTIPRGGAGRGGSKKCKPIPAPPLDAGLKSHPIPALSHLRGGENPHGAKRGGAGQPGRGKIAIPMCVCGWWWGGGIFRLQTNSMVDRI